MNAPMTNEQLVEAVEEAAGRVSYFNATDDPRCYREETPRRKAAERDLATLSDEAIKRGLYVNLRNHLCYDIARKFEAIAPKPAESDGSFFDIVNKCAGV